MKRKRVEMDSEKIKNVEEPPRKSDIKTITIIILSFLVLLMGLLILGFLYKYGGMNNWMKKDSPRGGDFPDVEFGEEPFGSLSVYCEGYSEGDVCEFERNNETISGICKMSGGGSLVCLPEKV